MTAHPLRRLGVLALALIGAIALAGEGVNLRITNDGIVDIFVTVYDMNTRPRSVMVDHQRNQWLCDDSGFGECRCDRSSQYFLDGHWRR